MEAEHLQQNLLRDFCSFHVAPALRSLRVTIEIRADHPIPHPQRGSDGRLPCFQRRQDCRCCAVTATRGVVVIVMQPETHPLLCSDPTCSPRLPDLEFTQPWQRQPVDQPQKHTRAHPHSNHISDSTCYGHTKAQPRASDLPLTFSCCPPALQSAMPAARSCCWRLCRPQSHAQQGSSHRRAATVECPAISAASHSPLRAARSASRTLRVRPTARIGRSGSRSPLHLACHSAQSHPDHHQTTIRAAFDLHMRR